MERYWDWGVRNGLGLSERGVGIGLRFAFGEGVGVSWAGPGGRVVRSGLRWVEIACW